MHPRAALPAGPTCAASETRAVATTPVTALGSLLLRARRAVAVAVVTTGGR